MDHCIKEFLVQAIKYHGDTHFCISQEKNGEVFHTYSNLMNDICRCMSLYDELKDEGNIGLWAETGYEAVVAVFAAFLKGRFIAIIDPSLSWEDASALMKKADVSTVIYGKTAVKCEGFGKDETYRKVSSESYKAYAPFPIEQFPDVSMKAPALLLFTSGTTGTSKGVVLSFYSLYKQSDLGAWKNPDSVLSILPCYHIYFFIQLCYVLKTGSIMIFSKGIASVLEEMQKFQPTFMCVVPIMLVNVFESAKRIANGDTEKLPEIIKKLTGGRFRIMISGGAGTDRSIFDYYEKAGIIIAEGYGMTEFGGALATNRSDSNVKGSVGELVPFQHCKIVDGEVYIKSEALFLGYYKDKEATDEVMKDGWFATGDLGYIEDNHLFLTGRKKNLIILENGENVSPEELERLIIVSPDVDEVLVKEDNNVICAEIYSRLYATIPDAELVDRINDSVNEINTELPSYKKIAKTKIRKVPFTKSNIGKIIRGAKEEPGIYIEKGYVAPATPLEEAVCKMAREILEIEKVGVDDDFLELGIHSISFVRFNQALEEAGYKIDISKMFDCTTPRKLAAMIESMNR
ncbi:MAG: AMP-binding protein [Lachnospiraceae bacterium]|nr:AMP-binding protein [Lachnospiraceae bacterium]